MFQQHYAVPREAPGARLDANVGGQVRLILLGRDSRRDHRGACLLYTSVKYNNHGCTRRAKNPQYIAENILNRDFHAKAPNAKWLTDVTEFKWYEGIEFHKVYLSAILDLYDRRIVSFEMCIRDRP